MTSGTKRILEMAQYLAFGAIVSFTAYCLHFNLELTDESFYLYFYQWGPKVSSFNFYHLLLSPLSAFFSHKLIIYRYLSLVTLLGSAFLLFKACVKQRHHSFWMLPISLALTYFNSLATFSYNTLSLIGSATVLSLIYFILNDKKQIFCSVLIGFISFLTFSARFGAGAILLLTSITFTYSFLSDKKFAWKLILIQLMTFLILTIALFLLWPVGWHQTFENITFITQSSHQGLLAKYLNDTGRFLLRSLLPPLTILFLSKKFYPRKLCFIACVYFSWVLISQLIIGDKFTGFGYYLVGFLLAYSCFEMQNPRNFLKFVILPFVLYFSCSLGTNNNLFKSSSYNLLLLYPCILYFLKDKNRCLNGMVFVVTLFVSFHGILKNQFLQTYRGLPRSQQSWVRSVLPALSGIWIDSRMEKKLVNLNHNLHAQGFDPAHDKIFAYPNLPGVVSLLEVQAFGNPWNSITYPGSDKTSCAFLKREVRAKVFAVTKQKPPAYLMNCLLESSLEVQWVEF